MAVAEKSNGGQCRQCPPYADGCNRPAGTARQSRWKVLVALALPICLAQFASAQQQPATAPARVVRCAVIGGMIETGFWQALSDRFEKETGIHVEVAASGPKDGIDRVFRQGGVDLITMHSSDTIINLVADGWASDPQPWVRNDMILVGPPDDPAGVKGMTDAAAAFQKIAEKKAAFVVHSSLGAQEVLNTILTNNEIELDPAHTTILFEDRQRMVMGIVAEKKAYTLIGRIPFRNGKIPNQGMIGMVQGDAQLRRPFVVAVANPRKVPDARLQLAWRLSAYLRSPETQQWIGEFGKGKWDDLPTFFPLESSPTIQPADAALIVQGEVEHPLQLDLKTFSTLPRTTVQTTDRQGKPTRYSGVALQAVLARAGATSGKVMGGGSSATFIVARSPDGYRAVFSLGELDHDAQNPIIIADRHDDQPLAATEGPLRLVVPGDPRPIRWVRQVSVVEVRQP